VTASGRVQVFYGERTLTADSIAYDSANDRIVAEGPITLRTGEGETVFADFADLDADLRDGLVRGARSVIADGGAKISAVEARRVDNRYNVLQKAVFSPCEVCAERPVPIWRIRARRILHDQVKGEIHYQDAYFDLMGVPIGYLPYFRHPSPEVKRATGFLPPKVERDHAYGAAVKLPYYIVLDDHSDVTLTPFLSYSDGALLEVEYRRLFERGRLNLNLSGGVTDYSDDPRGARPRIGGFGEGRYLTDSGVRVGFDLAFAADDPFLRRYDYTDADRLTTTAFARVYDGRNHATVEASYLQSLRDFEDQDLIPIAAPAFSARHVIDAPGLGGELGFSLDGIALTRPAGRDVGRVSFGADWSRQAVTAGGLALRGFADARFDYYAIGDDPAFPSDASRFAPRAGVEARMPFIRADSDGGTHIFEPIAQFVVAPENIFDGDIPNEDSVLAEYDATNLFEPDREPGFDRFESGSRVTLGARYEYFLGDGTEIRATAGRILRFDQIRDFTAGSGLNDAETDYVANWPLADLRVGHVFTKALACNWKIFW
ncbi:MAG: LPS-assembly protein LptD, partial [Planctomycetota bacterium]